jgi:hypothetical protein
MSVIIINIIPEIESVRVFENLNRTKTEGNLGNCEPNRTELKKQFLKIPLRITKTMCYSLQIFRLI